MIASQNIPNVASAEREAPGGDSSAHDVWMYDPWCRTPWYTGALTKALQTSGQRVRLVCPDYPFEPGYFLTLGLHPRPGAINVAAHCGAVSSRWLRPVRVAEYGINVAALCLQARRRQPQIVHQQQCVLLDHGWKAETRFLRWCRARGSRIVYTAHNLRPHGSGPHPMPKPT